MHPQGFELMYPHKIRGFEFMRVLLADISQADLAKQLTMHEVLDRFSIIKAGLSEWNLRSRVTREKESLVVRGFWFIFPSWFYILRQYPHPNTEIIFR
jgi:hypothetical protein